MLTERRKRILNLIVNDYVSGAIPVPSESISRNLPDKVSSATIRNEVMRLDEEGYVFRQHISAGSIPSDKGYRYYVENLLAGIDLPESEKNAIAESFGRFRQELEELGRFAVRALSQRLKNVSLVTLSKGSDCRLRHIELVYLGDLVALLIMVFEQVTVKKQVVTFAEKVTAGQLEVMTNRLNSFYKGKDRTEIEAATVEVNPAEDLIRSAVIEAMKAEDENATIDSYFEGMRYLLAQPEFSKDPKLAELLQVIEEGRAVKSILSQQPIDESIEVIIGGENKEEALTRCSIVLGTYGASGKVRGTLGVIGPTRMRYLSAMSTVRYMCRLLSKASEELP